MSQFILLLFIAISSLWSTYTYAQLRDPTQPANISTIAVDQNGGLEVNAIILSGQRQVAVINGAIVKVGDQVFGNKVVGMDANSVHLEGVNGRITLFLLKPSIKKTIQ